LEVKDPEFGGALSLSAYNFVFPPYFYLKYLFSEITEVRSLEHRNGVTFVPHFMRIGHVTFVPLLIRIGHVTFVPHLMRIGHVTFVPLLIRIGHVTFVPHLTRIGHVVLKVTKWHLDVQLQWDIFPHKYCRISDHNIRNMRSADTGNTAVIFPKKNYSYLTKEETLNS
jgi:hypothetical protein